MIEDLFREIERLEGEVENLKTQETPRMVYRTSPLTAAAWTVNARSTTAKTLIDLSAVFGVPAGARAVLVRFACRDSDSAASATSLYAILSPNNTAASGPLILRPNGAPNDATREQCAVVPCNTDGDVYFECQASGALTMDITLEIWGYVL
jgi:hypothetical protein